MERRIILFIVLIICALGVRSEDSIKVSAADQQAFVAQRDTAGGKTTMKAYLWKVCGDEYDAQHSNG